MSFVLACHNQLKLSWKLMLLHVLVKADHMNLSSTSWFGGKLGRYHMQNMCQWSNTSHRDSQGNWPPNATRFTVAGESSISASLQNIRRKSTKCKRSLQLLGTNLDCLEGLTYPFRRIGCTTWLLMNVVWTIAGCVSCLNCSVVRVDQCS